MTVEIERDNQNEWLTKLQIIPMFGYYILV